MGAFTRISRKPVRDRVELVSPERNLCPLSREAERVGVPTSKFGVGGRRASSSTQVPSPLLPACWRAGDESVGPLPFQSAGKPGIHHTWGSFSPTMSHWHLTQSCVGGGRGVHPCEESVPHAHPLRRPRGWAAQCGVLHLTYASGEWHRADPSAAVSHQGSMDFSGMEPVYTG